jgi:hypothetical protein
VIAGPIGPSGATGATGPSGATGPAGPSVVSTDLGNTAILGTDSFIYVPATTVTDEWVNITGDTMTGSLSFNDAGGGGLIDVMTAGGQLRLAIMGTTKFQIADTGVSSRVPFFLPADPVDGFEAVTKQYCDANGGGASDVVWVGTDAPVDPTVEMWWDSDEPPASLFDQALADTLYVSLPGDTMTGPLVLPANPVAAMEAATKQYVDTTAVTRNGTPTDNPMIGTLWFTNAAGSANLVLRNGDDTPHIAFHSTIGTSLGSLSIGADFMRLTALDGKRLAFYAAGGERGYIEGSSGNWKFANATYVGGVPNAAPFTAGALCRPDGPVLTRVTAAAVSNAAMYRGGAANAVNGTFINFMAGADGVAGTSIGGILMNALTTVQYKTTSDPRTKTTPPVTRGISNAVDRVRQLGAQAWVGQHIDPATGQPEPGDWDFLSSHDIQDAAPYVVSGERDGVATQEDVDAGYASAVGDPKYQMVGFADLVPLVIAALSQVIDRVTALEGTP